MRMLQFNADFLRGKGLANFDINTIFDRVINLKLTTDLDTYIIRSDFEIIQPDQSVTSVFKIGNVVTDRYFIRKCQIKPSIKVQYTVPSNGNNIKIDIYISNFYMLDSTGKCLMTFSDVYNKLRNIRLMMGYYSQFKERFKTKLANNTMTYDDLADFNGGYGVDVVDINVDYTTTDKMPPDSVLHIHGYVGDVYSAPLGSIKNTSYEALEAEGLIEKTIDDFTFRKETYVERMFYKYITKRFVRPGAQIGGLTYLDLRTRADGTQVNSNYEKSVFDTNGFMTDVDAEKYGVKFFCSEGVKAYAKSDIKSKITNGNDELMDIEIRFAEGYNEVNTFNRINTAFGDPFVARQLVNGNWIVYTKEEGADPESLKKKFELDDYEGAVDGKFYYKNILPAVYNISVGSLTSVVAPFFYFVNPFDPVYFSSRYKTSDAVQYYSNIGEAKLTVQKQEVSFATVENVNEMTLLCSNTKEE